ncbi:MAG: LacI family DNA-binding transcriptional regulator [Clostridiaceae bacterium]
MNIYKIAELAGVSVATVSKVINGRDEISEDTRRKVFEIIESNNFKPKVSATVMDTLAVFFPAGRETHLSNPYFSSILFGVGDIAYDYDFGITIINTGRLPKKPGEFLKFCRQRKISGGIFALLTVDDNYVAGLAEKFPVVSISQKFEGYPVGCVQADNFTGGYEAVKYLIDCGHKKIMFINPSIKYLDHIMRNDGGEKALQEAGLSKYPEEIQYSLTLSDTDLGYSLDKAFADRERPTALFIASDQEALRIMRILQEKGVKIPEDISIVGFDDLSFAENINPPLTTVRQPIYDVGREACRMLINMMQKSGTQEVADMTLKTKLMIRKSVKRLNE